MRTTKSKRAEFKKFVNEAKVKLKEIKNDTTLSPEGINQNSKPVVEMVNEFRVNAAVPMHEEKGMIESQIADLKVKIDHAQLVNRSAVLGASILELTPEKLVQLYRQRFSDPIDRTLIEEIISVKLDTAGNTGKEAAFIEKFNQAQAELEQTLPQWPDKLKLLQQIDYIDNVIRELELDAHEVTGKKLQEGEAIEWTMLRQSADRFESNFTPEVSHSKSNDGLKELEEFQNEFFAKQKQKLDDISAVLEERTAEQQ